jgi:hypothetical protein
MTEEKPHTPFGDMIALWQKMMWEGFEMMLKAPAFSAGVGRAVEGSTALREQIQGSIQASLKAMQMPTVEDLRRITEGLSAMQAQLETVKSYLGAVQAGVQLQEEWRRGMDETIQRLIAYQAEGQRSFQLWTKQVEERFQGLQQSWETVAKQWNEGLQRAAALAEASQRSMEELNKTVWDISRKTLGLS